MPPQDPDPKQHNPDAPKDFEPETGATPEPAGPAPGGEPQKESAPKAGTGPKKEGGPDKPFEPETGSLSASGEFRLDRLAEKYSELQEPLPPEDPDKPASWEEDIFTTTAWHRHLVFLIAAMCLAGAALWFYYAAEQAEQFLEWVHQEASWALFIILPLGFCFITWLRNNAFQGTQGTGIPQTIASLRMRPDLRGKVLSARIAIGKLILTTLGLFSGASIGREGPTVHVGASLMHICQRFARFPKNLTDRGLILGGGAAGIAASFNAPFAGIVFACEEIGRSFEKENMGTIIRTVAIACIAVIAAIDNNYLFYGSVKTSLYEPWQWLVAIPLIGIICGALGGAFSQLLKLCMKPVARLAKRHGMKVAIVIGGTLAGVAVISNGESIGSGFLDARAIIQNEPGGESLSVFYPLYRALVTFTTLLSGIPGGLFDPTLSTGAGLGKNLAPLFQQIGPIPTEAVVLMAMTAYFTGVVQSPITSMIIMVEMTSAVAMSLPLLAVSIIAYEVARKICPVSLYETIAEDFLHDIRKQHADEEEAKQAAARRAGEMQKGSGI